MQLKRKTILILVIVALMSVMVMGCNNDPDEVVVDSDPSDPIDFELFVSLAITSKVAEILAELTYPYYFYDFDFLPAYANYHNLEDDHWFFEQEDDGNWGVMIWADAPLYNFQVIMLTHEFDEEEEDEYGLSTITTSVSHVLYEIDVLPAGVPIVLSRFVTVGGVIPWEGISFEDMNGTRRYFAIADDRRGEPGDPPYFLHEFVNGGEWGTISTNNNPFRIPLEESEVWASHIIVDFN